jgi:hypothetical protein
MPPQEADFRWPFGGKAKGAEAPLTNSTLPQLRAQVNLDSQVGALPRFGVRRFRSDAGSRLLGVGSTLLREAPNRVEPLHCSATAAA